eukprot:gene3396-8433_t
MWKYPLSNASLLFTLLVFRAGGTKGSRSQPYLTPVKCEYGSLRVDIDHSRFKCCGESPCTGDLKFLTTKALGAKVCSRAIDDTGCHSCNMEYIFYDFQRRGESSADGQCYRFKDMLNDLVKCEVNERKTLHANGTCTCKAGLVGRMCEYSNGDTCSGDGVAQFDGSCACNDGFDGPSCEYSRTKTCNSAGTLNRTITTFINGMHRRDSWPRSWGGDLLRCCWNSRYNNYVYKSEVKDGTEDCEDGSDETDPPFIKCQDSRKEIDGVKCVCDAGFAGPACEYTDKTTCSGAGAAQLDGSCVCNDGFAGPSCEYSNTLTCSSVGTVDSSGECTCNNPSVGIGPNCQLSNTKNCNNVADVLPSGTCSQPCEIGHAGANCDQCTTDTHDKLEDGTVSRTTSCTSSNCSTPTTVPFIKCVLKGGVKKCGLGELAADDECVPCPSNTYADGTRADGITSDGGIRVQCTLCPAGTLSQPGSTSLNDCVASCQPGAYSANAACTTCSTSTYADGTGRRTACKPCPEGSSNNLEGSATINQCVCANDAAAREYFYISEAEKACNTCPPNEISVAGEATSAADCFAKYITPDEGQRFCYGSGKDSRSKGNVDSLAFALARVGTRTDVFDEPWKSCEEAKTLLFPDSKFIRPDELTCSGFREGTCWDATARGGAKLPFGCVMNTATKEIMYFDDGASDANLYYDGFDYVPVCERYVCPPNLDGDIERPVPVTKPEILLDTTKIPVCSLSSVSIDAYNDEATKENNTVFIPIAFSLSILCMLLAACLTRDNLKWQWIIFGVGMRTFDFQTDWGFYIINMRNKGFETVYTNGLLAGDASAGKIFKASLPGFQNASLAITIVGMLLTPLDVWGNRQRALGKHSLAMTISIVVLILEDVPQLLFNIKFMFAMGSSDPVSILSLAASIGNIVYNVGLIIYELCGGHTPSLPSWCKSNRLAELEELTQIAIEEDRARQQAQRKAEIGDKNQQLFLAKAQGAAVVGAKDREIERLQAQLAAAERQLAGEGDESKSSGKGKKRQGEGKRKSSGNGKKRQGEGKSKSSGNGKKRQGEGKSKSSGNGKKRQADGHHTSTRQLIKSKGFGERKTTTKNPMFNNDEYLDTAANNDEYLDIAA